MSKSMPKIETPTMEKVEPISSASLDEHAVLRDMVEFKRELLVKLQHAVLNEQATLQTLKQEIADAHRDQKYVQQQEQQAFKESLDAQGHELQNERRQLERLELELEARRKEVEQLEAQAIPVQEALQKLADERLAIELQRVRNQDLALENDRISNSVTGLQQEASDLKAKNAVEAARLIHQASDQESREQGLLLREKDIALQVENLMALKETIDPKLAEVDALATQAGKDRQQAEVLRDEALKLQSDLDKQKSDLAILSNQLQAKAEALTEYDASLKRTDAELRIKAQQATVETPA